jgi:hypothetical protein
MLQRVELLAAADLVAGTLVPVAFVGDVSGIELVDALAARPETGQSRFDTTAAIDDAGRNDDRIRAEAERMRGITASLRLAAPGPGALVRSAAADPIAALTCYVRGMRPSR